MPFIKLQFKPGVNRDQTDYSNEGGWYECDKIRFRSGYPEKIGGGGGGGGNTSGYAGKNGGSGVVIISVPTAQYSGTYTGTPSISVSGLNTILQFNSSGSYTA